MTRTPEVTASPYLTANESARYLKMALSTFYLHVVPSVPAIRPTPGRILFDKADLDRYVERMKQS
jgi:hypothetical protein